MDRHPLKAERRRDYGTCRLYLYCTELLDDGMHALKTTSQAGSMTIVVPRAGLWYRTCGDPCWRKERSWGMFSPDSSFGTW